MKVYAKQVNPRYQESPLWLGAEFFPVNIAVCGNRDFDKHLPEVFKRVQDVLDAGELAEVLEDMSKKTYFKEASLLDYASIKEACTFMIPKTSGEYSREEAEALAALVLYYSQERNSSRQDEVLCKVLSIVDGRKWSGRTIRGNCQGDWQNVFYPVDEWSREELNVFEIEYFNTGSEWIIKEVEDVPDDADDGPGWSIYCTSWNYDGIRREIIDALGYEPDSLKLYKWTGERTVDVHEEV